MKPRRVVLDSHLLSLKPWRGIAIFDPAAFVERMDSFED